MILEFPEPDNISDDEESLPWLSPLQAVLLAAVASLGIWALIIWGICSVIH